MAIPRARCAGGSGPPRGSWGNDFGLKVPSFSAAPGNGGLLVAKGELKWRVRLSTSGNWYTRSRQMSLVYRVCVRACVASSTPAHGSDSGSLRMRATSRTSLPSSAASCARTSSLEGVAMAPAPLQKSAFEPHPAPPQLHYAPAARHIRFPFAPSSKRGSGPKSGPLKGSENQRPHFEHLGCLAPDMTRMGLRGLILSIWTPWPQIWPERASEVPF